MSDGEERKKVGRQLSLNSHGNHYADVHRQEAERMLEGGNSLKSPTGSQKSSSFFSHLRKRARRLSGRNQGTVTPQDDDVEANAGCAPWAANKQSSETQTIAPAAANPSTDPNYAELDRALQNVRYSLDATAGAANLQAKTPKRMASNPALLKRHHSLPYGVEEKPTANAPVSTRTRRSVRYTNPSPHYETPDEEDELLDEALMSAHHAVTGMDSVVASTSSRVLARPQPQHVLSDPGTSAYLTPSPSKDNNNVNFGSHDYTPSKPVAIPPQVAQQKNTVNPQWPTPPYEESDWAASAAASIFATQAAYR
jgi:meiosis induction protein kinase IME2/SME1